MTSAEALRLPRLRRVLRPQWALGAIVGSAVLVFLFILTAADAYGRASLWENLHWTFAAAVAASLSIYAVASRPRHRAIAVLMAAGPTLTFLGSLLYDIVWLRSAFSVPAIYDPVFLAAGPLVVLGLFLAARRVLSQAEGIAFLIDAAIAVATVAIVTIALFDTTMATIGGASALLLAAYPVVFMGTALAIAFALLVLRRHSTGPGLLLIGIGSLLMGLDWGSWLAVAVEGPPPVGSALNYAWSVGAVLTGIGTVTWRFEPTVIGDADDLRLFRGLIPVVAVLISLGVLILVETELQLAIAALVAVSVILAMARQSLLLFEREGHAQRESAALQEAVLQRRAAEVALDSQRAAEQRYRSTVEVFDKLGDQMHLAAEESGLFRSAVAAMNRLAPSDFGELLVVNSTQSGLAVAVSWGDNGRSADLELDGPPARCPGIRRGSPYLVDHVADELTLTCPVHPQMGGSVMCVPLMALGETIGVAHLGRRAPATFDADEPRAVLRVAEQVALAVANTRMLKTMESLALTDQLTQLYNARFFDPFLDRELATAERDKEPLGVIMIDLDHFKRFNDTNGHAAGDDALKAFARAVLTVARESDTVARYGGEEFVVAVRHADLDGAVALAERMREAVERTPVELGPGRFAPITASFGVASTSGLGGDRRALMKRADDALFHAKHLGRNRVESGPSLRPRQ